MTKHLAFHKIYVKKRDGFSSEGSVQLLLDWIVKKKIPLSYFP